MYTNPKHIVIDARIRRASTGRPVDRFLHHLPELDDQNNYTVLVEPSDDIKFDTKNIQTKVCRYKRFSFNPVQQVGFALQLYRLKPDLVFFTMTGLTPLFYFGKNITFTHDLTMLRFVRAGRLPQWIHEIRMLGYRLLFWKGNKFATKIITPTDFVKKDLTAYSSALKNKIIRVYESSEGNHPGKAIAANVTKPYVFHQGSPFPHKNIENLVLAFQILKKDYPGLSLVLAGKKEYYFEQLETWINQNNYGQDVQILGFVEDRMSKWLFQNAECYVLPSLSEGFSIPGLEAMMYDLPLASSGASCLPEVYGDAALYFDPNDPKDIAKTVAKILDSEEIKKDLIKKGANQLKKYSWQKMTKEILDVINSEL